MKKLVLLAAVTLAMLSACHTVSGVGKDVSAGGQHLQNAAE
ncbi:entericidin A/B family lipoprotein [Neisseriaceae bacterium ESL0693]|nr:entericidin A/B family lipoprotein [Neisseriaceae bacterium ESL0693]